MTQPTEGYTYCFNGRDGTFDLIEIVSPEGKPIATLHYWDEPDTDEAVRVARSARLICQHLNQWWFSGERVEVGASNPNDGKPDTAVQGTEMVAITDTEHSPAPWRYEYSPWTVRSEHDTRGVDAEIPAYEVFDAEGNKVFDTNENSPAQIQEGNARLGACAPRLLAALVTCANLLTDYEESNGEEGDAYREAIAAIAETDVETPSGDGKPIVILVRGGVVKDVCNLPRGSRYEIMDYDSCEEITW